MKHRLKTAENLLILLLLVVCLILTLLPLANPRLVMPRFDIRMVAALCLAALVMERCFDGNATVPPFFSALLAALGFGLLPLCAALTDTAAAGRLALLGGVTFGLLRPIFASMTDRAASKPMGRWAALVNATVLFLAVHGLLRLV